MSGVSPENREARYTHLMDSAERSRNRGISWILASIATGIAATLSAQYIDQKFYPLVNTLEEIQQGPWEKLDPITQAGLTASLGMVGFILVGTTCVLAAGYYGIQSLKYHNQANRFLKEAVDQSKRPPTLKS